MCSQPLQAELDSTGSLLLPAAFLAHHWPGLGSVQVAVQLQLLETGEQLLAPALLSTLPGTQHALLTWLAAADRRLRAAPASSWDVKSISRLTGPQLSIKAKCIPAAAAQWPQQQRAGSAALHPQQHGQQQQRGCTPAYQALVQRLGALSGTSGRGAVASSLLAKLVAAQAGQQSMQAQRTHSPRLQQQQLEPQQHSVSTLIAAATMLARVAQQADHPGAPAASAAPPTAELAGARHGAGLEATLQSMLALQRSLSSNSSALPMYDAPLPAPSLADVYASAQQQRQLAPAQAPPPQRGLSVGAGFAAGGGSGHRDLIFKKRGRPLVHAAGGSASVAPAPNAVHRRNCLARQGSNPAPPQQHQAAAAAVAPSQHARVLSRSRSSGLAHELGSLPGLPGPSSAAGLPLQHGAELGNLMVRQPMKVEEAAGPEAPQQPASGLASPLRRRSSSGNSEQHAAAAVAAATACAAPAAAPVSSSELTAADLVAGGTPRTASLYAPCHGGRVDGKQAGLDTAPAGAPERATSFTSAASEHLAALAAALQALPPPPRAAGASAACDVAGAAREQELPPASDVALAVDSLLLLHQVQPAPADSQTPLQRSPAQACTAAPPPVVGRPGANAATGAHWALAAAAPCADARLGAQPPTVAVLCDLLSEVSETAKHVHELVGSMRERRRRAHPPSPAGGSAAAAAAYNSGSPSPAKRARLDDGVAPGGDATAPGRGGGADHEGAAAAAVGCTAPLVGEPPLRRLARDHGSSNRRMVPVLESVAHEHLVEQADELLCVTQAQLRTLAALVVPCLAEVESLSQQLEEERLVASRNLSAASRGVEAVHALEAALEAMRQQLDDARATAAAHEARASRVRAELAGMHMRGAAMAAAAADAYGHGGEGAFKTMAAVVTRMMGVANRASGLSDAERLELVGSSAELLNAITTPGC